MRSIYFTPIIRPVTTTSSLHKPISTQEIKNGGSQSGFFQSWCGVSKKPNKPVGPLPPKPKLSSDPIKPSVPKSAHGIQGPNIKESLRSRCEKGISGLPVFSSFQEFEQSLQRIAIYNAYQKENMARKDNSHDENKVPRGNPHYENIAFRESPHSENITPRGTPMIKILYLGYQI